MAVVVNDRDVMLQNAAQRTITVQLPVNVVVPGYVGIALAASQNFFRIPNQGNPVPQEIQIDAVLKQVQGTVQWSVVEGNATLQGVLGGSNLSRILSASQMASDYIVVQASVTDERSGTTYSDQMAFSKVRDGPPGERGMATVFWEVQSPGWDSVAAANALASRGITDLRIGDMVTLQYVPNGIPQWTETRFFDGTYWVYTRQIVSGNMLVQGTVGANAMAANSITATNAALANASVTNAKIAARIQSDNYTQGGNTWFGSGWAIDKTSIRTQTIGSTTFTVQAEFAGVVLSRPVVVASGIWTNPNPSPTYGSGGNGTWQTNAHFRVDIDEYGTWTRFMRPNTTSVVPPAGQTKLGTPGFSCVIDTGFNDYNSITSTNRPSYIARAFNNLSNYQTEPVNVLVGQGVLLYRVPLEATIATEIDHTPIGTSVPGQGGRLLIQCRCDHLRDVYNSGQPTGTLITNMFLHQITWALYQVT